MVRRNQKDVSSILRNKFLRKPFVLSFLIGVICISDCFSQEINPFDKLGEYHRFQFSIAPTLYAPAESNLISGVHTLNNLPILGLNLGFELDLRPTKQWSVITGLFFVREPAYKTHFKIKKEDIGLGLEEDLTVKSFVSRTPCLKMPLLFSWKKKLAHARFLELRTGFQIRALLPSEHIYEQFYGPPEGPNKLIFELEAYSPNRFFHGSFMLGGGVNSAFDRVLMKMILIYTYNRQPTYSGTYNFVNMNQSGNSFGEYQMSGNHLSLIVNFAFMKHKYKETYHEIDFN